MIASGRAPRVAGPFFRDDTHSVQLQPCVAMTHEYHSAQDLQCSDFETPETGNSISKYRVSISALAVWLYLLTLYEHTSDFRILEKHTSTSRRDARLTCGWDPTPVVRHPTEQQSTFESTHEKSRVETGHRPSSSGGMPVVSLMRSLVSVRSRAAHILSHARASAPP